MPRATIDYMNARRDAKPASGGKRYAVVRNAVDDRAQWQSLDKLAQVHLEIDHIFADFRRWAAHSRPADRVAMLARGETLDDLAF